MGSDKKPTILYVEDEKQVRDELTNFLEYFSSKLYVAVDGREGFELYKENQIDIVISDINMPNMNGIEMTKHIKTIDENQHIILTTAHSESHYFIDAIECQVEGYLLKPIDLDMLESKLKKIIGQINLKTDHKKHLMQLIETQKMAALGELIGNIGHQWRQPLSVISSSASAIKLQNELTSLNNDQLNSFCNSIDKSTQYLSTVLEDFNNLIKQDSIKRVFRIEDIIDSFLDLIAYSIKDSGIEIILDLKDNIKICSYKNELIQCLMNIFENSKDILISTNNNSKYIFITSELINDIVIIKIKDNGGGISNDILPKIFEPYTTTKHSAQGVGLGLHLTYRFIVDGMDGTVEANNINYEYDGNQYTGAEFIVSLPIE